MINIVIASGLLAAIMERNDSRSLRRTRRKMIVAARIADALEAAGLSQKEFAQMMGKQPSEISDWLSGERNFTIETLADIEDVLKIDILNVEPRNFRKVRADMPIIYQYKSKKTLKQVAAQAYAASPSAILFQA